MPTILIVEDRKPDRDYLKILLGHEGYKVVEASDGAEALDTVSATLPDLVITDVLMPTMDGFEFVRRMRERPGVSDTPVIFYSAMYNELETRVLAQQCGVTAVLLKPSPAQDLLAKVDEVLTRGRRHVNEVTRADFDERHVQVVGDKLLMKIGELEATEQRLAAVVTLFHQFTSQIDPLVILQDVCSAARDITMAQHALIGVVSDDGTRVVHLLTSGMAPGAAGAADRAVLQGPLLGPILESRTPVRKTNPGGRPETLGLPSTDSPVHSYLGVPIASPTRVHGWIELRNKLGANEFGRGDEQVGIMIATQAGIAYENARLVEDLRRNTEALQTTNERTQFALEASRVGIWDIDYTTGVLRWSEMLEAQYGLPPGTFGGTFAEFVDRIHPDDRVSVLETVGKAMKSGTDFTVENRTIWPDGTVRWLSGAGRVHLGAQGEPVRGVGISRDVTAGKTLELELRQALKLEAVGRLASGIAHEINTPIQFISDSVHFVQDAMKDLPPVVAKYRAVNELVLADRPARAAADAAAQADREADVDYLMANVPPSLTRSIDGLNRVVDIVRAMKEFGHPDRTEMAAVDLNQALKSTLIVARNEYKYVAEVETDFGVLPLVQCHGGEVNQVFLNILVNAAHAIGDTFTGATVEGRIAIQTRLDGDTVVVRISDNGGGIPLAIRDRLFDPFFTTKAVGKGTGQGLAIARSVIVEKHAGSLTFETEDGHGTTFVIRLPVDGQRPPAE